VTHRVNHQREYRAADGTTNNQAEAYISRIRGMQLGQHHPFGLAQLAHYANEATYPEDTRRLPNGEIFRNILTKCAHTPPHRDWCGYWAGAIGVAHNPWPPESSHPRPGSRRIGRPNGAHRALARQAPQHRQGRPLQRRQGLGAVLQTLTPRDRHRHPLIRQGARGIAQNLQDHPLTLPRPEPALTAAPRPWPNPPEVVVRVEHPDGRIPMAPFARQSVRLSTTVLRLPGQFAPLGEQPAHDV